MFGRIPYPKMGHEILAEGMEDILKNLMARRLKEQELGQTEAYRQAELQQTGPLREAQAKAAKAKAERDQLVANALSDIYGRGNVNQDTSSVNYPENRPYQLTEEEQAKIEGLQPGESLQVGQGQQPKREMTQRQKQAKELLQALGVLKETPTEQQEREVSTDWQRKLGDVDIKQVENWNNTITASHQMVPALEHNQEILANPVVQDMYKRPEYFGYDLAYLKRFGTPEQQKYLILKFKNTLSNFIQ